MIIYGSFGLGDAIYLYNVVKYYVDRGEDVTIITRYPEVYAPLRCKTVKPDQFINCQCSARTKEPDTNIYEDTLIMAGINDRLPLEFDYAFPYQKDRKPLTDSGRPTCVVRNLTAPAKGEEDAKVMIPDVSIFQKIIDTFKDRVDFVSVGWQIGCEYKLNGLARDLSSINDLGEYFKTIDSADIVMTQPGHCVPIAEALNKKLFCVFARAGLESMEKRFRFTTPEKILTKKTSSWCVDDESEQEIYNKFKAVLCF